MWYTSILEKRVTQTFRKELFEAFAQNDRFDIVLSRHERISKISNDLKLLEGGGTYCYFNKAGYLTISVYRGSAKRMYGLKRNHSLMIEKQMIVRLVKMVFRPEEAPQLSKRFSIPENP